MNQQFRGGVFRIKQAAQYLGMGESTVWRKAKTDPDFPKPIKLSERVTAWRVDDLEAYIERQASEVSA